MGSTLGDDMFVPSGDGVVQSLEIDGSAATIVLQGQVDLVSVGEFERSLDACLKTGCAYITVDMSQVTFLDSVGLRALLSPLRHLPLESLVVRAPSPQVKRLLQLTGLEYLIGSGPPND